MSQEKLSNAEREAEVEDIRKSIERRKEVWRKGDELAGKPSVRSESVLKKLKKWIGR